MMTRMRAGKLDVRLGFGHELLVPALPRQIFDVSEFGNPKNPRPAGPGVLDGPINLCVGEIPLDMKHLSRVNEICVINLVTVSLKKKRPLIRIAINQSVRRNAPEVFAGMDNP